MRSSQTAPVGQVVVCVVVCAELGKDGALAATDGVSLASLLCERVPEKGSVCCGACVRVRVRVQGESFHSVVERESKGEGGCGGEVEGDDGGGGRVGFFFERKTSYAC